MQDSHLRPDRADDLAPSEEGVAHWFDALERHDAPASVHAAVLRRRPVAPAGRLLRFVPLGAWGLASAAVLLLALGGAVYVELSDPISVSVPTPESAGGIDDLTIVEDTRMALFHKVETFDDVGLARGRLIADWGR